MIRNRVLWILILVFQLILFTIGGWWCVYTAIAQLAVTIISLLSYLRTRNLIRTESELHKDGSFSVKAVLKDSRKRIILPVVIFMNFERENRLTGDIGNYCARLGLGPFMNEKVEIAPETVDCGTIELRATGFCVTDCLGIVGHYHTKSTKHVSVIIPDTYRVDVESMITDLPDLDGNVYSDRKPGFDLSETFRIREYKAGDKIRSVHWKLSSKQDELVIREGSFPVKNSLLLLMETCFDLEKDLLKDRSKKTVTALISMSESLCEAGIGHHIAWWNSQDESLSLFEVESTEQLEECLVEILSARGRTGAPSAMERFYDNIGEAEFPSVILVDNEIEH